MVVCIRQMLFNLNKAFNSNPWAYMSSNDSKYVQNDPTWAQNGTK